MGKRFSVETADIEIADFVDQSTLDLGDDIFGHGEDKIRGGKIRRSNLPDPLDGINSSIRDELKEPTSKKFRDKLGRIQSKTNGFIDPGLIKVAKIEKFLSKVEEEAERLGYKLPDGFISSAGDVLDSVKKYSSDFQEEISSAIGRLNGDMVDCSGETRPLETREVRDVPAQVYAGVEVIKCAASRGDKRLVSAILDSLFGDGTKRAVVMAAVNEAARNGDVSAVAILGALPLAHELISDSPNLPFNLINGIKDHYTKKESESFKKVMKMLDSFGKWGDKTGGTITRGHINKHKLNDLETKVKGLLPLADLTDPIVVKKPDELQYLYGTLVV